MTARIDHEDQANQAAAAGKYDIAQYHATMLIAEIMAASLTPMRTAAGSGGEWETVKDPRWAALLAGGLS